MEAAPPDEVEDTREANRRFYARIAEEYDRSEECVVEERLRQRLRTVLTRALAMLPPSPEVLDACGGSGNVSLVLQSLGVRPTIVDISPEMLAIYERKAIALGLSPAIEVGEIDEFLLSDRRSWDLIVFSSALHHLEDYEGTLELAAARLAPGGAIVTIFDPTVAGLLDRRLRRLEYILHVLIRTPWRVPALVRRRIAPSDAADSVDRTLGERAERHALAGIDDARVHRLFERLGLDVVVHERTYETRFGITRALYRLLRRTSAFHFIAVRPPAAS